MVQNSNVVFYPHSIVRGEVVEVRLLEERAFMHFRNHKNDAGQSLEGKPTNEFYTTFEGRYQVVLKDKSEKQRTFQFRRGRLPKVGDHNAYSTQFEVFDTGNVLSPGDEIIEKNIKNYP